MSDHAMTDNTVEEEGFTRRHFLTVATVVTGVVGVAATATPFVGYFKPSARAQALGAPVEVDVSKVEPGAMVTVEWRGKPIFIVHRTERMLAEVEKATPLLADPNSLQSIQPQYATNDYRSRRPPILVLIGVCTHLGCAPTARFDAGAPDIGPNWPGGFLCPCHGSRYDLAGRVFKDMPAPTNLTVPPYAYVDDGRILVGTDMSES